MQATHCGLAVAAAGLALCGAILVGGRQAPIVTSGRATDGTATGLLALRRTAVPGGIQVLPPPAPRGYRFRWSVDKGPLSTGETVSNGQLQLVKTARLTVGVGPDVDTQQLAADYKLTLAGVDPALRLAVVEGRAAALNRVAAAVTRDDRLRYISWPEDIEWEAAPADPLTTATDPATGVAYQWAFRHIGADRALRLAAGDPGILVGLVDSGVGNVRDLAGKVASAWYFPAASANAVDRDGHGTMVASIVAAPAGDGYGLAGFCGACRLDVVRIDAIHKYRDYQVAVAIRRLVDDGVRIVNLSLGEDPHGEGGNRYDDKAITDALGYAFAHGVLVVAAAGNEQTGYVAFPASFLQPAGGEPGPGLAVGSSNELDRRSRFSNWGAHLSLLAPGSFSHVCDSGIWAALPIPAPGLVHEGRCGPVQVDPVTDEHYAYSNGTSFAAPEVAGVAALVWAANPGLTSREVVSIILRSATRPAGSGWRSGRGWGVLNAARAVELARRPWP